MTSRIRIAGALVLAIVLSLPALGQAGSANRKELQERIRALEATQQQTTEVLAALRASIEAAAPATAQAELKQELESLEKQVAETNAALEALRKDVAAAPPAARRTGPVEAPGLTPLDLGPSGSTGQVSSGTSFNPALSVIAEGLYYADNRSGGAQGLIPGSDGFAGTPVGEGRDLSRGFNLGETELTFSGAVDPYFDVTAIASFSPDGVSVEEAYGRTRNLPAGLAVKLGKFYSDIGYANKQHPHQWDFVDQSLPYEILLGGGLNDVGVQLTWLPKTPVYLLLGVEAFQGDNPGVANLLGPDASPTFTDEAGPRLFTGFVKISPDIGYSDALQIGLSGGLSSLHQEESGQDGLEGTAWFAGTDWVFKHDSPEPFGRNDFVFQAEYLYREKNLDRVAAEDPATIGKPSTAKQDAFYVQGTWGLAPRFTVSVRYDAVGAFVNRVDLGDLGLSDYEASRRVSLALTFNPTEFSRLRAQFSRGNAILGGVSESFNQFFLQFQLSLGVHGAHKF
ncbi:MAG TPA: hypothetical protein VE129_18975 [Thermoanaerobaculia bacterium]|nr:hypothetical protein [Thermoanaerobaculia bacterium]